MGMSDVESWICRMVVVNRLSELRKEEAVLKTVDRMSNYFRHRIEDMK